MSFKYKHELEKLPEKIKALETEITALKEKLSQSDLYIKDPEHFDTVSRRYAQAQLDLEISEQRWLELDEMRQK